MSQGQSSIVVQHDVVSGKLTFTGCLTQLRDLEIDCSLEKKMSSGGRRGICKSFVG